MSRVLRAPRSCLGFGFLLLFWCCSCRTSLGISPLWHRSCSPVSRGYFRPCLFYSLCYWWPLHSGSIVGPSTPSPHCLASAAAPPFLRRATQLPAPFVST